MIEHILLFRWNETATQESIDYAMVELRSLKDKIPGIADVSSGKNFSERSKGFTHGLVFRFKDRAALEGYIPHPEHQRVVQKILNPIRADILVVDYEV
ncbi:MAG TPA: Dabb family protein [Candidatus Sulfotelmatobacter sp.]|nr:Dabb family protein [Candidatus Sulfotelmatobacter sp.]